MIDIRLQQYSAPGAKLVLPEQISLPDILQLREERIGTLDSAKPTVPGLPSARLKLIKDELAFAGDKLTNYIHLSETLQEFFSERLQVLAQKRYTLLLRWARAAQSATGIERLSPGLVSMLDGCLDEYETCMKNLARVKHYRDALPRGLSPSESALKAPPVPITPKGAKIFTRWLASSGRTQRRLNKFFARMLWGPTLKKYDTIRKAKDLVAQSISSVSAAAPVTGSSMPTMVTAPEKLSQILEQLREQFSIAAELEEDDGQRFQYEANRLAQSIHATQAADKVFPLFGSSFIEKLRGEGVAAAAIAATIASRMHPSNSNSGNDTAAAAAAALDLSTGDHQTTFLKEARWLDSIVVEPDLDAELVLQNSILGGNKKLDHILKVEISFVDEDDIAIVTKRLQEQVTSHADRAVAHTELDQAAIAAKFPAAAAGAGVGGGAAGDGIGQSAASKSASSLPAHRLLPYYWLRLLRLRQSKRRVLSCLNYLRSVERRMCIDMHGFAFNAAHSGGGRGGSGSANNGGDGNDGAGASGTAAAASRSPPRQSAASGMLAEKGSGSSGGAGKGPTLDSIREGGPTVEHDIFAVPRDFSMDIDTVMSLEVRMKICPMFF